jgi:hypothetical protein
MHEMHHSVLFSAAVLRRVWHTPNIRWLWALARRFLAKLVFYRLRGAGGEQTAHSSDNFSEKSTH